jgi:hypothetical protein
MPIDTSFYTGLLAPPPPTPLVLLSQVLNAQRAFGTPRASRERPERGGMNPLAQMYYLSHLVPPPDAPYGWMTPWIRTPSSLPPNAPSAPSSPPVAMPYGWMTPWIRTPRDR